MRLLFIVFALCISAPVFCQVNLEDGLRLHYKFSEKTEDLSGHNNKPKFYNTKLTEDRHGTPNSACHFNGKNSYIRVPDAVSLHMTDQISLCVWIRPTGFYTKKCHCNSVLQKGKSTGRTLFFIRYDDYLFTNGRHCDTAVDKDHENFYGPGAAPPAYTPYVQAFQWQSVVYTYDGTTAKLYVGCRLVKSMETVSLYFTNPADLFIGKVDVDGYEFWLNADLDDVRIYDRAINADEVAAIAECKDGVNSTVKTTDH